MTLMIECSGSAKDEILTELEFNPPPDFKSVQEAIDWAEEHYPINTYFEVWSNSRIWYQGHARLSGRRRQGVHWKNTALGDGRSSV